MWENNLDPISSTLLRNEEPEDRRPKKARRIA
jgi:hypothetical protein